MKHKLCREMVYVSYSMINAYAHESNRSFQIKRGGLHHIYVVNRYDIEVYGSKDDLKALRTWFINKIEAGGYVKESRTTWKKVEDGQKLYFNLDEVFSQIGGVSCRPILRIHPSVY